jgi:hypothetical protein
MRIVPFPDHDDGAPEQAWLGELEAALGGAETGPESECWRQLREDVRALAPSPSADFERELAAMLAERSPRKRAAASRRRAPAAGRAGVGLARLRALRAGLRRPGRQALAGASGLVAIAAVVLAILVIPGSPNGGSTAARPEPRVGANAGRASGAPSIKAPAASAGGATAARATAGPSVSVTNEPAAAGAPSSAPGRVQQLAASITLAVIPANVQSAAARVARLTVDEGGYVQSSHVQVQQAGASEASLELRLPSEKLSAALASLERVAPVRDESQSLQDITGSYDAARDRLADATAAHAALLRALAHASAQEQVDSLRERLAQASTALTRARVVFEAVSRQASTAEVEVTVLADAHAGSQGLTLGRGLDDAARVLVVSLTVLLIGAAVLAPATLALLALIAALRAWRRNRREHALDAG